MMNIYVNKYPVEPEDITQYNVYSRNQKKYHTIDKIAILITLWESFYTAAGKSLGMGCQWLPETYKTYDMKHI